MPIPTPNENEDSKKFISRCMGDEIMKKDYPENEQRILQKPQQPEEIVLLAW
jgi:hypothetical protein